MRTEEAQSTETRIEMNGGTIMSSDLVKIHLESFWPNCQRGYFTWELGPIKDVLPSFLVCRIAPQSSQEPWIYVSIGANSVEMGAEYGVEFLLLAPDDNARHIETLAIVAHYHATTKNKLDAGRIVNCGRPWLDSSPCDHMLVSLPYPFGPNLEWCRNSLSKDTRLLWLLPITKSEASFAASCGIESLEQRFDQREIDAIDPHRKAVA
jgi:hypothetical protein